MFIAVGFLVVGLVLLGIALTISFSSPLFIVVGGGFSAAMIVAAIISYFQDKKRQYCKDCKVKYDFEDDVAYRQIGHRVKTFNYNENDAKGDRQLRSREFFKLEVSCTCPQCQKSTFFTREFIGRETFYDGSINDKDPELEIENYFTNPHKDRKFNIGMAIVGIICAIAGIFMLMAPPQLFSGVKSDSEGDPENYYATYYALDTDGQIWELALKKDRTYDLRIIDPLEDDTQTADGKFYYKNQEAANKALDNAKHTDKAALFLETEEKDQYIVLWIIGDTLEMNQRDLLFTQERLGRYDVLLDASNLQGTYYGTNNKDTEFILTLKGNSFALLQGIVVNGQEYAGGYQYVAASVAKSRYPNAKPWGTGALICHNTYYGEKDKSIIIWVKEEGSSYSMKIDGESVIMNTESNATTLEDKMEASVGFSAQGSFRYNAQNRLYIGNYGADLTIDGSTESYLYFVADSKYLSAVFDRNSGRNAVVVYKGPDMKADGTWKSSEVYIFEIVGDDLVFQSSYTFSREN